MDLSPKDIAIDLGTANTLIYVRGKGVVLDEPSVVTIDQNTHKVVAAGNEARDLAGRQAEDFEIFRPLRDGVIRDYDIASAMIRAFLVKVVPQVFLWRPKLLLTVPTGVTGVEKRALIEAAKKAGAGKVYLIQEPLAAAIGTGLRIDRPVGHMLVDIGGGTTEVAVICKFAVIKGESLRMAGDSFNESIQQYVRHEHRLDISEMMAEIIKLKIGSVSPSEKKLRVRFKGRDIASGELRSVILTTQEVRDAIKRPTMAIINEVKRVLGNVSPDLAVDIAENGIWLAGGGALLKGWSSLFLDQAGLEVKLSQDPLRSTIRGAGAATEQFDVYRTVLQNGKPPKRGNSE